MTEDPRIAALPDIHGHAKGEHKPFAEERPIPYTARMLFLWFFHACRRGSPRFLMVADHMNYLTFEDPAAVNLVRRALKLAQAGDLYGAAETAGVEIGHAAVVSEGLRKGMRYSIGAEIDNDPRSRPDAQNIVDAMKPDGTVRSVHFIPIVHPQHGENWMWAFDNPEFKDLYDVVGTDTVWETYMATLLDAIDKLPGNIVGHFYVPAKFGHWPDDAILEGYEDRFLDACLERGMAVEVNSRYIYKFFVDDEANLAKFRAVHLRLLRKAKEKGVAIAVGSDAHSPKDQGGAFEAVLALLDEAEINEIAFPIGGRIARVALRATEEILRQHTAALAPPLPPPIAHVEAAHEAEDAEEEAPPLEPAQPEPEPVLAAAPKRKRPAPKAAAAEAPPAAAPPVEAEPPEAAPLPEAVAPAKSSTPPEHKPKKQKSPAKEPSMVDAIVETVASIVPAAAAATVAVVAAMKKATRPKAAPAHEPATPAVPEHPAPAAAKAVAPASKPAAKTGKPKPVVKAASPKKPAPKTAAAKSVAKKPAAKAPVAKKAAAKKAAPPARKAAVKKVAPGKPAAKKAASKKPVAKAVATKGVATKGVAKKAAAKKSAPKKATAKRPAPRKPAARKPVKKTAKRSRR